MVTEQAEARLQARLRVEHPRQRGHEAMVVQGEAVVDEEVANLKSFQRTAVLLQS